MSVWSDDSHKVLGLTPIEGNAAHYFQVCEARPTPRHSPISKMATATTTTTKRSHKKMAETDAVLAMPEEAALREFLAGSPGRAGCENEAMVDAPSIPRGNRPPNDVCVLNTDGSLKIFTFVSWDEVRTCLGCKLLQFVPSTRTTDWFVMDEEGMLVGKTRNALAESIMGHQVHGGRYFGPIAIVSQQIMDDDHD